MGAATSQINQSNLNRIRTGAFNHDVELEKQKTQPKILVSINRDNTVRISEGISTATQTPRNGYGMNVDENVQAQNEEKHKEKETMIEESRNNLSVLTDITCENNKEHMKCRVDPVISSPKILNGEEQISLQEADQIIPSSTEAGYSETEASVTDDWNDTNIQMDDFVDYRGENDLNDAQAIVPVQFDEAKQENDGIIKNSQILNKSYFSAIEGRGTENKVVAVHQSSDTRLQTDDDAGHEHLGPRIAWRSESLNSNRSLQEDNNYEENEGYTQATYNTPTTARAFEQLSLDRYGKYKVRLSSDKEKCIISSATFLETGDAVMIDRSNQKMKFVDKDFQFISSFDLPAKPWAVCSRGVDIYVTMGNTKIQHLTIEDMIIEPVEVFEIKGRCLGICVYGEHLAVGLQVGEVSLLDLKGKKQSAIQLPTFNGKPCNPWHLTVTAENNILVTDSDAGTLYCVNDKSELIFSFKGLGSPRGTTIDSVGNILLVGRDKESGAVVTIIHKDGELHHMLHIEEQWQMKSRVLMTWEQLEFVPYCIAFRKDLVVILGGLQDSLKIMKI